MFIILKHVIIIVILYFKDDVKDLNSQLEGLEAHLDYIQEHVTESQGTIMGMEVVLSFFFSFSTQFHPKKFNVFNFYFFIKDEGEGINTADVINTCTLTESKYLLEHFYSKSVEMVNFYFVFLR